MPKYLNGSVLAFLGSLLLGCAPAATTSLPSASDACPSGTAAILVYDGFLARGCGCTEGAGTFAAGSALTCTVNTGTSVAFYFIATRVRHQIQFSSVPATANASVSQVFPPGTRTGAYGVTLGVAGTYSFSDSFDSALSGSFTVL